MTSGSVEVRDVRIRHDENEYWAPNGTSFSLTPGTVTLLLGPSGSGKSTLALSLNGLVPDAIAADIEGTVLIEGEDIAGRAPGQISERVSMVFQDPEAQIVTSTILDEVCFGPENLQLPVDAVLARAERALRQVGLWERRAETPDRLSGGGKQRLAIAAALAMATPILVLDEPTANLDPAGIAEVYSVLKDLVETGGHTVLLIEHNLDAAIDLVDRVIVLDGQGRVTLDGTPREIFDAGHQTLLRLGVWLPIAAIAGLRLRRAGLPLDPLPLTPHELGAALDALPSVPDPVPADRHAIVADPDVTPLLDVRALRVVRRRDELLHGVSLSVPRGDFLAVVGPNGAGKTTLIQAMAGVVRPPRGQVFVQGKDVSRMDVRDLTAQVGFVFQNPEHQFITGTVADELAHGLRLQRLPESEITERVDAMLERFGLTAQRDRHPYLLSGGQKRRLSVGTALITGAPLLVLDEPTFGQDRSRAAELLALLRDLNRQGTTIVVVSHDLQLVADYANRVAVVADGSLLGIGPSEEILADTDLLQRAGLLPPPLAQAFAGLEHHPIWRSVARLDQLPGAEGWRNREH